MLKPKLKTVVRTMLIDKKCRRLSQNHRANIKVENYNLLLRGDRKMRKKPWMHVSGWQI